MTPDREDRLRRAGSTDPEVQAAYHAEAMADARRVVAASQPHDWQDRWAPLINLLFALAYTWLAGAIWHPNHQTLRWALIAVSTAYLTWTITAYIHTRRTR